MNKYIKGLYNSCWHANTNFINKIDHVKETSIKRQK